jgi:hypothetical protein
MVYGLVISDSANLKLAALKLLEICHSWGDYFMAYFVGIRSASCRCCR